MAITFDETNHQYYNDDQPIISVTQLMQEQGVAPNYSAVKSEILKMAADRGTLIHGEIEDYIKTGNIGFTNEVNSFIEYINKNNIQVVNSEFLVANDIVAGRADLLLNVDGVNYIADIKTTSVVHTSSVAWQLALYVYLLNDPNVNTEYGFVYHFDEEGFLNVKKITLVSQAEVSKLIGCHANNTIYSTALTVEEQAQLSALAELQGTIKQYKDRIKKIEAESQRFTDTLIAQMKEHGILKLEVPGVIAVTYIAPTTKVIVDADKLKTDYPEIYDQCQKTSNVKESVRIKVYE